MVRMELHARGPSVRWGGVMDLSREAAVIGSVRAPSRRTISGTSVREAKQSPWGQVGGGGYVFPVADNVSDYP